MTWYVISAPDATLDLLDDSAVAACVAAAGGDALPRPPPSRTTRRASSFHDGKLFAHRPGAAVGSSGSAARRCA
jgi:hypothetical protein